MILSKTIYDHLDSWGFYSKRSSGEFHKIDHIVYRPEDNRVRPNEFYNMVILEDAEQTNQIRDVETLVDLMGDLGGLIEIILIFTSLMMAKF